MFVRHSYLPGIIVLTAFVNCAALAQTAESLEMMRKLQALQLDQLGNPQIKSDVIPPVLSTVERPHRMLILPVQYADRNFDRFMGEEDADTKNQAYLQSLLFAEDLTQPTVKTLTHYYYHQSKGNYFVT